jgi:hypothetical protein
LPRKLELQLDELGDEVQLLSEPCEVAGFSFEQQQLLQLHGEVGVELKLLEGGGMSLREWMEQQQQKQQGKQQGKEGGDEERQGEGVTVSYLQEKGGEQERQGGGVNISCRQEQGEMKQQQQKEQQQEEESQHQHVEEEEGSSMGHHYQQQQQQKEQLEPLQPVVLSWFQADCGDGGWLSTGPGATYYGHWQQSIEMHPLGAAAADGSGAGGGGAAAVASQSIAPDAAADAAGGGLAWGKGGVVKLVTQWALDRLIFRIES